MGAFYVLYIAEIIIAMLVLIIGNIILKKKNKTGIGKVIGIVIPILIVALVGTFLLEKPNMRVKNMQTIEVNSGAIVEKPNTTYHFQNITNSVNINDEVDYTKAGEYEVKYEVNTILGKYVKTSKVKVVDNICPKITLKESVDYKISYKAEYVEPGFSAIDQNDGDLTDKVIQTKEIIDENNFKIKYEVEDSSHNKCEVIRNVTIVDDVPPVITLNGNDNMELIINGKYDEQGAKAEDEKDGDLTSSIEIDGTVDTSKEGTYSITYKVKDKSGNEAVVKRNVIVKKQVVQANTNTNKTKTTSQNANNNAQTTTATQKGVIYLTFDDGPSSNITPKVLDILKQKGVKATFFILNYDSNGEKLVKRAYSEGHTIAIHGYSHDYSQIYVSEEAYMSNIKKLQEKIKNSTGYNATITRFPGGSSNTVSKKYNKGIMTRLTKLVVNSGYKYFDWNVSSGDAGGVSNSDQLYNNVVNGLSKSKANVVLMHDFSSNQKLLDALPRIIDYGLANGYTFERITESTPMVTHRVNN